MLSSHQALEGAFCLHPLCSLAQRRKCRKFFMFFHHFSDHTVLFFNPSAVKSREAKKRKTFFHLIAQFFSCDRSYCICLPYVADTEFNISCIPRTRPLQCRVLVVFLIQVKGCTRESSKKISCPHSFLCIY